MYIFETDCTIVIKMYIFLSTFWIFSPFFYALSPIFLPVVNSWNPRPWKETFIKSLSPLGFAPLSPHLLMSFKQMNFWIPPTQKTLPQKHLLVFLHWFITEVQLISHTIQSGIASRYIMTGTSCERWFQILVLPAEKMSVLSLNNRHRVV